MVVLLVYWIASELLVNGTAALDIAHMLEPQVTSNPSRFSLARFGSGQNVHT